MDFSQLKQKVCLQFIFKIIIYEELFEKTYQFLGEILKFYYIIWERIQVNYDEKNVNQLILSKFDNDYLSKSDISGEYITFCKKLLKNLLLLKGYKYDDIKKDCSKLYVWLYFEMKKFMISDYIIKEIFEFPTSIEHESVQYKYCPYFSFNDKINNPEKLMKLLIFNGSALNFQSMLKENNVLHDCNLKNYIYECVDIYKEMNITYSSEKCNSSSYEIICEIINDFNKLYSEYILNKNEITHNFPDLTPNTITNVIVGCPLEGNYSDSFFDERQLVTPITKGVSTALGCNGWNIITISVIV
ncbi:hypothetical protein PCYB_005630 [Plasmodium cynomolgi strain B]|uniref:CYIR protein n=1 Tax=Plasmodium cynomolgi (strain B) TaxID=1120755 RepID=K6V0G0_PLACD|nr:hypothetical protein PCYB_005630 [Plasmodium cynomolgi strain B]GAB69814.1 hypothetical protein PCYB_005630 [Plasmodium cynomolgi strain B]